MNVMGIIFTNDASLGELTHKRTMASLPFGGRYRQVDFALSNLSCAGVRHAILGENSRVSRNCVIGGAFAPDEKKEISVTSKGAVVEANTVLLPGAML